MPLFRLYCVTLRVFTLLTINPKHYFLHSIMIQRVQTIYLFVAALLAVLAVALSVPYALSGTSALELNDFLPLTILSGIVAAVCLAAIFLFRNRVLQINVCRLALLLSIALLLIAGYFALQTEGQDLPQAGAAFPLLNIVFTVLGIRGIRADDRLVRSMDRLR